MNVIESLHAWGQQWAFGEPTAVELDPVLLMWWLHKRVDVSRLPSRRVVAQFDFCGAATVSFWLLLSRQDVTLCLTDPGFEVNLLVTADLATFYRLWGGRVRYVEALEKYGVTVDGVPSLARAFPRWLG